MNPKIKMYTDIKTLPIYQTLKKDVRFYNVEDIALQILYSRGITNPDDMYHFLYDNVNHLSKVELMKDSDKFSNLVGNALKNNLNIVFYTDYDVDGIASGATGVEGLTKLSKKLNSTSKINWYANNRFEDGYGITSKGVENLMKKYPDTNMIITTDNGIVGYEGVQKAKDLGLIVIVTDHHQEGETSTVADAIIDPHQKDCKSTFKDLCGTGVIFKLIIKLVWDLGYDIEEFYDLLDIVALGTVADLVPLVGDNRILVKEGLKLILQEKRLMFKALREKYNEMQSLKNGNNSASITSIDEELLGFNYGPAFNSLGRLNGCIDLAMDLIFETDYDKMLDIAEKIFETNERRKTLTADADEYTINLLEQNYPDGDGLPKVLVIENDTFHEGIVGLTASHIKELYNRPVIILTKVIKKEILNGVEVDVEYYTGSARSIDGFNIKECFDELKPFLTKYGGHKAAAGLTLKKENFNDFIKAIYEYADKHITDDMLCHIIKVDSAVNMDEVTEDFVDTLDTLKPYGMSFEKPKIGIKDLVVDLNKYKTPDISSCYCGKDGRTVRLLATNGFCAIMFKNPETFQKLEGRVLNNQPLKPIGYPAINVFNGVKSPQLKIESNYLF